MELPLGRYGDETWVSVLKDKASQEITKKKDGYDAKLAALMEKMKAV
jgi:hypothetical protein